MTSKTNSKASPACQPRRARRPSGILAASVAACALGLLMITLPSCTEASSADAKATINTSITEGTGMQNQDSSIRPFKFHAPESDLVDLRSRIANTRWPDRETVMDASEGVQLATMQKLAQYWAKDYDWRKCEAKLNAVPQFVTNIDGLEIHFIHVRSKNPNALPIIITHGWPGSIIEQLKIIGPLTDPVAYGGKAEDSFDVVIPSLPGHGFSGKPTAPGWTPVTIAKAWATLMQRLGYTRYVAQGGDWGNAVSEVMALQQPPGLLGIHTNMAATVPPDISKALSLHENPPADLTPEEQNAWNQLDDFYKNGLAYAEEMSCRPQTLYAIADSPVGLAAWMLDHDVIRSYKMITRIFLTDKTEGLTRDDDSRQRDALLANQYGGLVGAALLGHRADFNGRRLLRRAGRQNPGRREGRASPTRSMRPREAGYRKGLSQITLLQQASEGRALRCVGTTATLQRRNACGVQNPALTGQAEPAKSARICSARLDRIGAMEHYDAERDRSRTGGNTALHCARRSGSKNSSRGEPACWRHLYQYRLHPDEDDGGDSASRLPRSPACYRLWHSLRNRGR